tara:strand:+ start:267 stop:1079 length:813 start_codon:yes stop_codon:yes gene_type:complete
MSDLYVNGSSFATGWNEEYQDYNLVTPSKSYAEFLAERLNSNLYKHCYGGKPLQSSVDQTIEFCKGYKEKYGTFENLKVVVELTTLRYRQWQPVKMLNGEYAQPVAYVNRADINQWEVYFIQRSMDSDLTEHTKEIPADQITKEGFEQYYDELEMWYPTGEYASDKELQKHITTAHGHLSRGKEYLEENNIEYLFWWVSGKHRRLRFVISGVSESLGPRFLPNKVFYGTSVCDNDPNAFKGHPTLEGHDKISVALLDYASKHNFLGQGNG